MDQNIFKVININENIVSEFDKKTFGLVNSPASLVTEMLSDLDQELFSNPNMKWLDPASGSGIFIHYLVERLMHGLKYFIKNEEARYKYIMEDMIYFCEIRSDELLNINNIFNPNNSLKLNIYIGDFLSDNFNAYVNEVWKINKFDCILGNPPYQKIDGGNGGSAIPLYNLFTTKSISIADKVLFVIPTRWSVQGKNLDSFRNFMFDQKIKFLRVIPGNGSDIFGSGVDIKGGICYFLIDKDHDGNTKVNNIYYDLSKVRMLFTNKYDISIFEKIKSKDIKYMDSIVESRNFFGKNISGQKTLSNGKLCTEEKNNDDDLICFVSQKEGFKKYIQRSLVKEQYIEKYKVFTTKGTNIGSIGNTFFVGPNEVCTETYLVILCDSREKAEDIISYMKSRFFSYIYRKFNITQNSSKLMYRNIPLVLGTDEEVFSFFNFSKDEIEHITTSIKK
jgi:site-specific DNA-methyltransferase (adenine-specific)